MSVFFPIVEQGGLMFYTVPEGTELYRGDTTAYLNKDTIILTKETFFGHTQRTAGIYGVPGVYNTKRELYLLALDRPENYTMLSKLDDVEFTKALKSSFNNGKSRDSGVIKDKIVARMICRSGFDGYATNVMFESGFGDDISESTFHAEIMICNATEIVEFRKFIQDAEIAEHRRKHRQLEEARARKRPRRQESHDEGLDFSSIEW